MNPFGRLKLRFSRSLKVLLAIASLYGSVPELNAATPAPSKSLVMSANRRILKRIPPGTSGWATLGSYRLEGRITINAKSVSQQPVFRFANDFGVFLDSRGGMFSLIRGTAGGGYCPLNEAKEVRFRLRRDISSKTYSLEMWDEISGAYCSNEQTDPNPTLQNLSGEPFAIGAINDPQSPEMDVAFIRIYSAPGPISPLPPPRKVDNNAFGDLLDFEFEGNLNDSSGKGLHLEMTGGPLLFNNTLSYPPQMQVVAPASVRAGDTIKLQAIGYLNDDSNRISFDWIQRSIPPNTGILSDKSTTSVSFTARQPGEYEIEAVGLTETGQSVRRTFKLGAVVSDDNGVVVVSDPNINQLLGPMIRHGANPWTWFDERAITFADFQIDQLKGTNGAPAFWSNAPWQTNLSGTLTLVQGNATIVGTGTQFQRDFCGGGGFTRPTSKYAQIYIKYNSAEYPGTQGLARYNVIRCNSQTSMTVNAGWAHATGTQTGIQYARADGSLAGWWTNSNTPGNYYDNVLAFYTLYYRTGLTKYRDAARTLARNWWYGPFYDRGKNYDTLSMGGNFIAAGPARGQSITGLFLWALESGENIWPGMNYVLTYQKGVGYDFALSRNWVTQIGDLREQGYITAAYALAARYHPDSAMRTQYRNILKQYINLFWAPLQLPTGEWANTSPQNATYAGASSVTVTNGSNEIRLNGGTWTPGTFCVGDCGAGAYKAWVWFFKERANAELPGKTNADLGGDTVYYRVTNVTSSTTATLDRAYSGASGTKGAIVSSIVGFGTQPFMMALTAGVFGTYVYDTMQFYGDWPEATKVKQFTIDAGMWLVRNEAYDSRGHFLYGASGFLNCVALPNSPGCDGGSVLNGEAMRGIAAYYLFTRSYAARSQGDDLYTAVWCKPTGGWRCGEPGYVGSHGWYLEDPSTGFMLNRTDPRTNKWFGFFFGYGFGATWPAARVGGLSEASKSNVQINVRSLQLQGRRLNIRTLYPDGTEIQTYCTESPCNVEVTTNRGNPIARYEYSNGQGLLLSEGKWFPLALK